MTKCSKCHKRKAKRSCAALGTQLCPQCCGKLRGREIICPGSCPYLGKHSAYQERRIIERDKKAPFSPADDILRDERMAWLALHAEIPIFSLAARQESIRDRDAYAALVYARKHLEHKGTLILLSDSHLRPSNPLGEAVSKSLEDCRYQKRIILPGESQSYSIEEMCRVLDRVLLSVRTAAGEDLSGTNYLEQLFKRMSQLQAAPPTHRIDK